MRKIIAFSGAGVSNCSGLSTFRQSGNKILWENHDPRDVADYGTWKKNRELVYRFYNGRREQLKDAQPNAAHHMLKRLQDDYAARIYTQNVDDLFEKAGCHAVHVHGNLTRMACTDCGKSWDIGYGQWGLDDRCECGSEMVKPDVVFFDEHAPEYPNMWADFASLSAGDILLVMGTSGSVIPIGAVANRAKYRGVRTILSNLESNPIPNFIGNPQIQDNQFEYVLHGKASEKAEEIYDLVKRIVDDSV